MPGDNAFDSLIRRIEAMEHGLAELRREIENLNASSIQVPVPTTYSPSPTGSAAAPESPAPATKKRRKLDEGVFVTRALLFVGLLLLLCGAAFGLQLAFTHDLIGPRERVLMGLAAGLAVLFAGARLRAGPYRYLGEGFVGLGAGLVYLSLWAASSYFHFIAPGFALAAMFAVTFVLAALAYARTSERVAFLGLIGGYLTPVLLASDTPDRTALAAYLLVLGGMMLILAQIARFRFVEAATFVGAVLYAEQFAADPGSANWHWQQSLAVASLFFAEFSIALFVGARRTTIVSVNQIVLSAVNVGAYLIVLADVLGDRREIHGVALLLVAAVLLAAVADRRIAAAFRATYAWLAVATATLAIPAFFEGDSIARLLAVESAVLAAVAGRTRDLRIGAGAGLVFLTALALTLANFADLAGAAPFWNGRFATNAILTISLALSLWALRSWSENRSADVRTAIAVLWCVVNALGLLTLTTDTAWLADGRTDESWDQRGQLAVSFLWTAYAAAAFVAGLLRRGPLLRRIGVGLFVLTALKAFFYDFASLELGYRVLSLGALGLVLIAVSTLYQRFAIRERS